MGIPSQIIEQTSKLILSTKKHETMDLEELDYFIDADLSILGASQQVYMEYADAIQEEYSVYTSFMYKLVRKKALKQLLKNGRLYITDCFYDKYNEKALSNISHELSKL